MLLPSVLVLSMELFEQSLQRPAPRNTANDFSGFFFVLKALCALALPVRLGFCLEKWQCGKIESVVRAITLGLLILVANGCIWFAGCTLIHK